MNTEALSRNDRAATRRAAFAHAVEHGYSAKEAAIRAGYSAATAATAGCRLLKRPDVRAEMARIRASSPVYDDPLVFLVAVATGRAAASLSRVRAAIALLPYFHKPQRKRSK